MKIMISALAETAISLIGAATRGTFALFLSLLWRIARVITTIATLGMVDLSKVKFDGSAVAHIWAMLWPYLVSTQSWPILMPKTITLPAWAFNGWRKRSAKSWLWTPLVLGVSFTLIQHFNPAVTLSLAHWILPKESTFFLWSYFLSSHVLLTLAAAIGLHLALNTLAAFAIKHIWLPTWRFSPVSASMPLAGRTLVTLPLFCQPWLLFGLIGLGCWAVNYFGVQAVTYNGTIMTAIAKKDAHVFMHVLGQFGVLIAIMTFLRPAYAWVKQVLTLSWTKFCTALLLDEYTNAQVQGYYAISMRKKPDNPNERIQQDTPAMCDLVMTFLFDSIDAVITLILYTQIIWAIENSLRFSLPVFGWTPIIGHMMLVCLFFYAVFGTDGAVFVGMRLIGLNAEQRKLGAHFRVLMVMFEKYAEPIAAYRGEQREYDHLWRRFTAALANNYVILRWRMTLGVFTGAYGKVAQFLPLLTLAPFYFAGQIEAGAISQSSGSCAEILGALSLIVASFDKISEMLAYANRNGELRTALAQIAADRKAVRPRIEREEIEGELLDIAGMDLYLPEGGKLIVSDFNLKMSPGQGVLIRGPSGSGKTSLLRAIQGLTLWDNGQGKIRIAPHEKRIMLSQLAYLLTEGTLREQLLYPAAGGVSDEELIDTLKKVNLGDLLAGMADGVKAATPNWESLPESERQRILRSIGISSRAASDNASS
jgi:vitamin B12/bleomycin/antimicrobial peptide transport system ATP-binding/permease protein